MSFLRHRKIYPDALTLSTLGSLPTPASHRNEFSAGYSLASCTPALLASGSPASLILQPSVLPVDIIAANGNLSPFTVYQPRGPLHSTCRPSSSVSRNMKSSGNRNRLRFTA